ncbi:MAG: glycerophosphodiester phosphodiesterase family protein, partial [Anaerolineae bacterium]|nr:glycerophosphodiester phosphodiesterase family protein [Anaerolineae bacterium]
MIKIYINDCGEGSLAALMAVPQDAAERDLAARYAPILRFDVHEPFLPLAVGYTIFRESGASASFQRGYPVELAAAGESPAAFAIEYAIWWDWDIGHLYELEHVWVYVDAAGRVVRARASWHGEHRDMRLDGHLALDGDHVVVFSEPGKHAFAPTPAWFRERRAQFKRSETSALAGVGGVLVAPYIAGQVRSTPLAQRLVHTYLASCGFEPSWDFSREFVIRPEMLIPWPALCAWMPQRVNAILDRLAAEIPPAAYRFLRIGHRGAAAHAPDNTLLGIRRAAALGADMVEIDVQRTADRQVVLAHDAHLRAADGRYWPINRCTLDELRQVDLGAGERVPTFAEAVKVCQEEQLGIYIELKDFGAIPEVLRILRAEDYVGHSIAASFRPDWLAEVKAAWPELATSVLFNSIHVDPVRQAQAIGANYVHPCWARYPNPSSLLTSAWMARVREAELGVIC